MARFPRVPTGLASHPYTVQSPGDLPPGLRQPAEQGLEPGEPIHYIFVVPAQLFSQSWFGARYAPEQALLFTSRGVLHVQDAVTPGQPASTTYLQAPDLLYARLSLRLLYGQLELVGQVNDTLIRIVVEFNTAREELLQPGLHHLLQLALNQTTALPADLDQSEIALHQLAWLPPKFSNGLYHHGLHRGEHLLGFIFQPDIWNRRWRFFAHQVAANTLLALTDRQVIILEEDKKGKQANYGWFSTFCPLAGVAGMELKPGEAGPELQLCLGRGDVMVKRHITLEEKQAQTWQDLWGQYKFYGAKIDFPQYSG